MAAQKSHRTFYHATHDAVLCDRVDGVLGTRRIEPAALHLHAGQILTIEFDERNKRLL